MTWQRWAAVAALVGVVGCSDTPTEPEEPLVLLAPVVTAAWGATTVTLDWDAVDNAEMYEIWRGTTPQALTLLQDGFVGTMYTDNSVGPGEVYHFAINAVADTVESGLSASVATFPHTPPQTPGKMYENTSNNGSYFIFRIDNGIVSGEDLTQAQAAIAHLGLNTHENNNPVDPEFRSPHLTSGAGESLIAPATGYDFNDLIEADEASFVFAREDVLVSSGSVYLVKTEDGNFAKLKVISGDAGSPFEGTGDEEYIEFEFDYNNKGIILF